VRPICRSRLIYYAFLILLLRVQAFSQQFARNELTVGAALQTYSAQGCIPIGSGPLCQPETDYYAFVSAPVITYTRNLSPSLALEGTFRPSSQFLTASTLGAGRQTLALGGVRTGWRGQRWGFYGKVQTGVASYSCGSYENYPSPYSNCARVTHFALEYGGTVEYRLNARWSLRADGANLTMLDFDKILQRYSDGSPLVYLQGAVRQHFDAAIGATRSFGRTRDAKPERVPEKQDWDSGVTFALQPRTQPEFGFLNAYPEWGLWSSWNFSKHLAWDTTLLHSGRNPGAEDIDFQAGGRAFEALSGIKIGIRRDRMGYFAKVRPGIMTFGQTERQIIVHANNTVTFDNGMFSNFVLDTGAVLEVYPLRHSILRFEAGDATIFYLPKTVISAGQSYSISEQTLPSMLIGFGAGARF